MTEFSLLTQAKLILGISPAVPLSQLSLEEVHRRFVFKCNLESQVSLAQSPDGNQLYKFVVFPS